MKSSESYVVFMMYYKLRRSVNYDKYYMQLAIHYYFDVIINGYYIQLNYYVMLPRVMVLNIFLLHCLSTLVHCCVERASCLVSVIRYALLLLYCPSHLSLFVCFHYTVLTLLKLLLPITFIAIILIFPSDCNKLSFRLDQSIYANSRNIYFVEECRFISVSLMKVI